MAVTDLILPIPTGVSLETPPPNISRRLDLSLCGFEAMVVDTSKDMSDLLFKEVF